MTVHIVRLGSERLSDEGLRIGTDRRGRAQGRFRDNFYDVWLPNLAPSEALLKQALAAIANDDSRG